MKVIFMNNKELKQKNLYKIKNKDIKLIFLSCTSSYTKV